MHSLMDTAPESDRKIKFDFDGGEDRKAQRHDELVLMLNKLMEECASKNNGTNVVMLLVVARELVADHGKKGTDRIGRRDVKSAPRPYTSTGFAYSSAPS